MRSVGNSVDSERQLLEVIRQNPAIEIAGFCMISTHSSRYFIKNKN
jgi:hypothetical protein